MIKAHSFKISNPFWGPDASFLNLAIVIIFFTTFIHVFSFSDWTMHLPRVFASLLCVWSVYRIGYKTENKRIGLLAGWMLVTTFCFLFWSRVISADIFNLAAILLSAAFYYEFKYRTHFITYTIFFTLVMLFALCHDELALSVVSITLLPDLLTAQGWRKHCNKQVFFSIVFVFALYMFLIMTGHSIHLQQFFSSSMMSYWHGYSHFFNQVHYREPMYSYLAYLPAYLFPWVFFFIPAIAYQIVHWSKLTLGARWSMWAFVLSFICLSLHGARDSARTLVLIPFAMLVTAHWIGEDNFKHSRSYVAMITTILFLLIFFGYFLFA